MQNGRLNRKRSLATIKRVEAWLQNPPRYASPETTTRLAAELPPLVAEACDAGEDIAAWLAAALQEASADLPDGLEALLARRPGSWEADTLRDLAERPLHLPPSSTRSRLVDLIRRANEANVEIADWLASTFGEIAGALPMKAESLLLATRPGRRKDAFRQLVYGTIGWPGSPPFLPT